MHEFALLYLTGNFPVRSMYIWPWLMKTANTKRVFSPVPTGVTSSTSKSDFISLLVERMFYLFLYIWPKAVAGVIFIFLFIASSVRPVHVTRWTFLIALRRAGSVGPNSSLYKYLTNTPVLRNSYTFLALDICVWLFWDASWCAIVLCKNPGFPSWFSLFQH